MKTATLVSSPAVPAAVAAEAASPAAAKRGRGRLLLWVLGAFAVQLAAWTAWFIIAAQHRVAEVPLEHLR